MLKTVTSDDCKTRNITYDNESKTRNITNDNESKTRNIYDNESKTRNITYDNESKTRNITYDNKSSQLIIHAKDHDTHKSDKQNLCKLKLMLNFIQKKQSQICPPRCVNIYQTVP